MGEEKASVAGWDDDAQKEGGKGGDKRHHQRPNPWRPGINA